MRRKSVTISFRAPEDMLRQIDDERTPFGISRGEWVRGVITNRLFRESKEGRLEQLSEIANMVRRNEERLAQLDVKLARAVFLTLTSLSDIDPAEIGALVRNKLQD